MMRRLMGSYLGKLIILLLVFFLFISSAMAEANPALAPMFEDWIAGIRSGEAADITMSATLHAILPFGEKTVAAMNRLLSECSIQVGYQQSEQGETTKTQIFIGDALAVDFVEQDGNDMLAQTSLLPGMTIKSASGSPLDFLLGKGTEIPFWAADILDPNALADKIPDALAGLSDFAKEKAGSYHLSSMGTAKNAIVYTVPEESAQFIRDGLSQLADELNWPEASALLKTLILTDDAVITLYQSAEGKNMGLGVKANMGFENIISRKVTFLWVFVSDEKKSRHTLSLKAPAQKGADNLAVTGKMTLECLKTKNRLSFGLDIKNRLNNQSDRTQWDGQLDCLPAVDNQRLEGEIKRTYTDQEETDSILTIKPSLLALKMGDEVSIKGSARIAWARNKSVLTDATFSLQTGNAANIQWEETADTVTLDGLGETELAAMADKAQMAAAEAIWQAVMSLPEECLTLISQNISQEDWERIYQNAFQVVQ